MAHVTQEVRLDADICDVFDFVTDPDNFPSYVEGYARGRAMTERTVGEGAAYEWFASLGPWSVRTTEEVAAWAPPRRVAYRGVTLSVPFESSMELRRIGENATALRVDIDFHIPTRMGGRLAGGLVLRLAVRPHVSASLESLRRMFGSVDFGAQD